MHHRSYQSILPTHNKLLQKRWDENYYEEHRRRVRAANPIVDTTCPKLHPHIVVKLKKHQLEAERNAVIDRDNHNLMLRMDDLLVKGCEVDHINSYIHHSLNYEKRSDEMKKIQKENSHMLYRIQARGPNYRASEWLRDRKDKERLINMITLFPVVNKFRNSNKNRSQINPDTVKIDNDDEGDEDFNLRPEDTIDDLIDRAKKIVITINKESNPISEIKSYANPPSGVKLVIEALAVLFNLRSEDYYDEVNARMPSLYHLGVSLLANAQFLMKLITIKPDISTLRKLKFYINNADMTNEHISSCSFYACELWKCIKSLYENGIIHAKIRQLIQSDPSFSSQKYELFLASENDKYNSNIVSNSTSKQIEKPQLALKKDDLNNSLFSLEPGDTLQSITKQINDTELNSFPTSAISGLMSFSNPPQLVKFVFDAYCNLIHKCPSQVPKDFGKTRLTLPSINNFDRDSISANALVRFKAYVDYFEQPNISAAIIKRNSLEAYLLWDYSLSLYQYGVLQVKLRKLRAIEQTNLSLPTTVHPGTTTDKIQSDLDTPSKANSGNINLSKLIANEETEGHHSVSSNSSIKSKKE